MEGYDININSLKKIGEFVKTLGEFISILILS
jgi:hypothetical protein